MRNRALAFTAEQLLQTLKSFPVVNTYVVGFSGGADSTALLHAINTIQTRLNAPVSAVHVNHGIHPDADTWQQHCETFCHQHRIKLVCLKVALNNNSGKGLEAEARHLRYEAVSDLLKPGDCLLTAHHADDQAETLLLNLMRGSGVDGLTAMPESRPLGQGLLQRPLLQFRNSALKDYLRENKVDWTEDPSNLHLNHDRNFIRHQVIPLLEQRWPEVNQRLLLTLSAMTDARHLLEALADDYLQDHLPHPLVLQITQPCIENPELTKLVIRRWIKQSGRTGIPAYTLDSICRQMQHQGSDHKISVQWDGCSLRWYKNKLWLQTEKEIQPCPAVNWPGNTMEVKLGRDVGQLEFHVADKSRYGAQQLENGVPGAEFSVCARSNAERPVISLGGHHKSLKNIYQSFEIPPWLRDSIPLCCQNGEIVAIGDWCFNEAFASWLSERGLRLKWHPEHPLLHFIHKQQHVVNH
jgi:tRNA(Ile)-lysidine synthase